MKLLKFILPITAVASVGSMVTPLAVSCNNSNASKLTYYYKVDTNQNSNDWVITQYNIKYKNEIPCGTNKTVKNYNNNVYLPALNNNPKMISDALLNGYYNFLNELTNGKTSDELGFSNIDGNVSTYIKNAKVVDGQGSYSGYKFLNCNIYVKNNQIITLDLGNNDVDTKIRVNYTLIFRNLQLMLKGYDSNENASGKSYSLVDTSIYDDSYSSAYSPLSGDRTTELEDSANTDIDNNAKDNFSVTLDYKVADNKRGGSEKTQKVTWTRGYASFITADVFTLGNPVTCADTLLSMADAFENAKTIDAAGLE